MNDEISQNEVREILKTLVDSLEVIVDHSPIEPHLKESIFKKISELKERLTPLPPDGLLEEYVPK